MCVCVCVLVLLVVGWVVVEWGGGIAPARTALARGSAWSAQRGCPARVDCRTRKRAQGGAGGALAVSCSATAAALTACARPPSFPPAEEDKKKLETATEELKPLTDYMKKARGRPAMCQSAVVQRPEPAGHGLPCRL